MPATNVRSRWSGGDLIFEDLSGNQVLKIADSKLQGDFEASEFKIDGTAVTLTGAAVNLLIQGVAGGYKIARGVTTPTTASDDVVSGLATVVAVVVSLQDTPTMTMMFASGSIGDQAGTPAAGEFTLVTKKPTGAADVTPINSTTPWGAVNWIAIGT